MLWPMPMKPQVRTRQVKIFKNGRNQAVRIPREFELPGEDAIMRKEGDRLIIEPARRKSLLELLATWEPLDEDFPRSRILPLSLSTFDALLTRYQHRLRVYSPTERTCCPA